VQSNACFADDFIISEPYWFPLGNGTAATAVLRAIEVAGNTTIFTSDMYDTLAQNSTSQFNLTFSLLPGFFLDMKLGTGYVVPYPGGYFDMEDWDSLYTFRLSSEPLDYEDFGTRHSCV